MEQMDLETARMLLERKYGAGKVPQRFVDMLDEWRQFIGSGSAVNKEAVRQFTDRLSRTLGPEMASIQTWKVPLG